MPPAPQTMPSVPDPGPAAGFTAPSYTPVYVPQGTSAPQGTIVGGTSTYLLRPHWSDGNPSFYSSSPGQPVVPSTITSAQFPGPYQAAPAIWLGYVHASGFGIQADFFYYHQFWNAAANSTPAVDVTDATGMLSSFFGLPGNSYAFAASSSVNVSSWDLEATKSFFDSDWTCTAGAGLRYSYLEQKYGAASNSGGGLSQVDERNMFNGFGPTLSVSGRRRLGSFGIGTYGNARGALLFGEHDQRLTLNSGPLVNEGFDGGTYSASQRYVMPYLQLEWGLDYRLPIGRGSLVIENGIVGQAYFNAGNPSHATTDSSIVLGGIVATPTPSDGTFALFGLRSSIGFTY